MAKLLIIYDSVGEEKMTGELAPCPEDFLIAIPEDIISRWGRPQYRKIVQIHGIGDTGRMSTEWDTSIVQYIRDVLDGPIDLTESPSGE